MHEQLTSGHGTEEERRGRQHIRTPVDVSRLEVVHAKFKRRPIVKHPSRKTIYEIRCVRNSIRVERRRKERLRNHGASLVKNSTNCPLSPSILVGVAGDSKLEMDSFIVEERANVEIRY